MLRRILQWNHPLAGESARLRRIRRGRNLAWAHSVEVSDVVDDECTGFRRRKQLVLEIRRELCFLLIERAKASLVSFGKLRASANEILVVELYEKVLLGIESGCRSIVVDVLDAL